jgi:hypothetical protein
VRSRRPGWRLAGTCFRSAGTLPYRVRHAQATTRRGQNGSHRIDKALARARAVYLGEAPERKLEPNEIFHAEERRDRQLCQFGRPDNEPRELLLDVPGDACFDGRIHADDGSGAQLACAVRQVDGLERLEIGERRGGNALNQRDA